MLPTHGTSHRIGHATQYLFDGFYKPSTSGGKKMKRSNVFKLAMALFVILGLLITTAAVAAEKAKNAEETIQGMVEKSAKGSPVIKMDDGQTFMILGQNMTAMIGKTVKVTGTLSKGKSTRSIVVSHFEEVQN
jgi:hypothetical protein